MAKKLTFDNLPAAVEKILRLLSAEGTQHGAQYDGTQTTAQPELAARLAQIEAKIDYLQRTLTPDRPVMDMQAVCRALKLRPKAVSELAAKGVLPSREQGRKTVFYEDAVVRYFMTQPAWSANVSKPAAGEATGDESGDGRRRIGVDAASEILNRSAAAVYQLTAGGRVPFHKEGKKVYFYVDELREWAANHPARPRGKNKK